MIFINNVYSAYIQVGRNFTSEPAKRLFDDLLVKYNKLSRPVDNPSQAVTVKLTLQLTQLLDMVYSIYGQVRHSN